MLNRPCWWKLVSLIVFALPISFTCLGACRAATDFVREFAKNKPRVIIVVSGPQGRQMGQALQDAILHHADNRHPASDFPILSIKEAEAQAASGTDFSQSPVVFLLANREMTGPLPPTLAGYLPAPLPDAARRLSVINASLSGGKRPQVFTIALNAPDAARLQKLYAVFLARQSESFRALPFQRTFMTNKLALFSSDADRDMAEGWGNDSSPDVWNDTEWHPLADFSTLPASRMAERTPVWFLDRQVNDPVPASAVPLLAAHLVSPTTIVIVRRDPAAAPGEENGAVLFSAPSRLILQKKMRRYPTVAALTGAPPAEEALDLRGAKNTTLLISGIDSDSERAQVRALLAADMRDALGLAVQDSVTGLDTVGAPIPVERLQGTTDTVRLLRQANLRYVWHFAVTDYGGLTRYQSSETKLTPGAAPFPDTEPTKPGRGGGLFGGHKLSDAEYQRALADFQAQHDNWERKKRDYDARVQHASYLWERKIDTTFNAHTHGILSLVDLQGANGGAVVWHYDSQGHARQALPFQSDEVSVRGLDTRPAILPAPPNTETCPPALRLQAMRESNATVVDVLQETALLPSAAALLSPAAEIATPASAAPPSAGPRVASVDNGVVTLTVGDAQGLRLGDHVVVVLTARQIRDPATGAVLDTRVLTQAVLRVSQTGVCADCVPLTSADAAKLAQILPGMMVRLTAAHSAPGAVKRLP